MRMRAAVKAREQVPQLVQRYLDGDIDVDPFLSHRPTLDDVNRGFDLMHAQDGIRSVIEFTQGRTSTAALRGARKAALCAIRAIRVIVCCETHPPRA